MIAGVSAAVGANVTASGCGSDWLSTAPFVTGNARTTVFR